MWNTYVKTLTFSKLFPSSLPDVILLFIEAKSLTMNFYMRPNCDGEMYG